MAGGLSRRLWRATRVLLPAGQRARLKTWYRRSSRSDGRAAARFSLEGDRLLVEVADGPRLIVPANIRDDIEVHFTDSEYAAELFSFARSVPSPGVLFDVGANNGLFSLLYCGLHAFNRAFAYEPSPRFAARLGQIARMNAAGERITVVQTAVADTVGKTALLMDEHSGRVQLQQFEGTAREGWTPKAMPTTTLDAEAARVGNPSAIKIDVEGHEWEVLRGAAHLLASAKPLIFLELHLSFLEERRIAAAAVTALLTDRGYELRSLANDRMSASRLSRSWASVVHLVAKPSSRS